MWTNGSKVVLFRPSIHHKYVRGPQEPNSSLIKLWIWEKWMVQGCFTYCGIWPYLSFTRFHGSVWKNLNIWRDLCSSMLIRKCHWKECLNKANTWISKQLGFSEKGNMVASSISLTELNTFEGTLKCTFWGKPHNLQELWDVVFSLWIKYQFLSGSSWMTC